MSKEYTVEGILCIPMRWVLSADSKEDAKQELTTSRVVYDSYQTDVDFVDVDSLVFINEEDDE